MRRTVQIGQVLLQKGLIEERQLDRAVQLQKRTPGKRLGDILIDLGYVTEEAMAKALAEQLHLPYVDLYQYPIQPEALNLVEQTYAQRNNVLPVEIRNRELVVATSDPLAYYTLEELHKLTGYDINTLVVEKSVLQTVIEQNFTGSAVRTAAETLGRERERRAEDDVLTLTDDRVEGTPVARLISTLLVQAARMDASDIHIEPTKENVVIRLRINGDLVSHTTMNRNAHTAITTRIKLMSEMDIAEKRIPQDGKFHFSGSGLEMDIRTSSLPTVEGEKLVLRLLGSSNHPELLDITRLGMGERDLEIYRNMTRAPNGIILVTGPTGSGKTTTLYATLNLLARETMNVITIEDPVEQRLSSVNQVQVQNKAGLTFASALRSILRQDPDIIMVGEMRDAETASLGMRAAITGHLVLTTLHTNDSMSSIIRMIDMGSTPYMVAAALTGVVAQRLVKVLCPRCKRKKPVDERGRLLLGDDRITVTETYEPVGCQFCSGTGYVGRRPIYEIVKVDEILRSMIARGATLMELRDYEREKGTRFLRDEVLDLVCEGETSLAEMERVVYSVD